jgi:uncharacterized UBP type Zn finger protein
MLRGIANPNGAFLCAFNSLLQAIFCVIDVPLVAGLFLEIATGPAEKTLLAKSLLDGLSLLSQGAAKPVEIMFFTFVLKQLNDELLGFQNYDAMEILGAVLDTSTSIAGRCYGTMHTESKCTTCGNVSKSQLEPFRFLTLCLKGTSLVDALNHTLMSDETVTFTCSECKNDASTQRVLLDKLPQPLVIQLKRFTHGLGKDKRSIECHESLDLSEYCSEPEGSHVYQLVCSVSHKGETLSSGHYTSTARDPHDGKWALIDDDKVKPLEDPSHQAAYMLIYQVNMKRGRI